MNNNDKKMLWLVKGTITVFNMPSTWFVFYDLFSHTDRPEWLAVFNTFMAILAVDAVFLWLLQGLENISLPPIKRFPFAIMSVALSFLVVLIGIIDEGSVLAFAPRIGMLVLVFNDLLSWGTDAYEKYFSREQIEQRIRNREVIHKRNANKKAKIWAVNDLKTEIREKQRQRILEEMGCAEKSETRDKVVPERSVPPISVKSVEEELPENIFKLDTGAYGWINSAGKEVVQKSLGGGYTKRGAKQALTRHTNGTNNGN